MSPGTELGIEKEIEPIHTIGDVFRDRKIPYGVLQAGMKELLRAERVAAMTRAPNISSFSGTVLPTLAEVKAAMPAGGINVIDLANLFAPYWYGMEIEFAELMEQAGTFNIPSQMYFPTELSGRELQPFPTLEEIRKVIPADGIRRRELMHIFEDRIHGRWKEFFYLVSCASVRKSGWLFAKPFSVVVWTDPVAKACAQNSTTTAWSNRALSPGEELPPVLWPANAYRTAELGSGSISSP
ncbi:transcription factor IIF subunit tfg1 [Elasticomyces elasticus]|nr:transcription factor IIF subunit tfg1 [Elasticomyces elasticus]KAK3653826.1 transcription factor IIF subunit tfg1 [Elasticomyces elasticus]KAK4916028.1 transcription factor IIF subunit tfg1 [Elasticomyces elasticus]KAK5755410.1 transcription factor IIF subunit tfg1 [Elasticomyces elasticus]